MIRHYYDELNYIKPNELASYLRTQNWKRIDSYKGNLSIWIFENSEGQQAELLLPHNDQLPDFLQRMEDAVRLLEIVEQRPILSIVNSIINSRSDILRFRFVSADSAKGAISLAKATSFTKGIESLLLSAACATNQAKPYYPKLNINEAKEYLNKCRLGQSERGSYILTVLSPVTPALIQQNLFSDNEEDDEIFERKVLTTLFNSLYHLKNAVNEGSENAIEQVIEKGVSANLCEALALMQPDEEDGYLDIGVDWSRLRPVKSPIPQRKIKLTSDIFPLFVESAKYLKKKAPIDNIELTGLIRKLESENPSNGGKVTIQAYIDDKYTSVNMDLKHQDYQIVVTAHSEYRPISVTGELRKEGRSHKLLNVRDLRIEE